MAASAVELCSQDANKAQDEAKCFIGIEAACLVLNLHIARARPCFNCFKELIRECLVKAYPKVLPVHQHCHLR